MRYFVRSGEGAPEKGPYDREQVAKSYDKGLLGATAVARAEDSEEWVPLKTLLADEVAKKKGDAFVGRRSGGEDRVDYEALQAQRSGTGLMYTGIAVCVVGIIATMMTSGQSVFIGAIIGGVIMAIRGAVRRGG